MAQTTERLRRSLNDELEECRSEDVERRLDDLSALESALRTEQVTAELNVFAALGNEVQYALVRVLVAAQEELCVCKLHAVVDVTESGLSHALSALVDAGLVTVLKGSVSNE
ncbi:ArsR family transcriptional regulator [Halocatena marina]|uniref:ArsR family transcriptional regulator n=1 Tax=Halocatena marina TaxID=2934937 RepID=A0ABD5YQP1_9EURY|nr:ArsR family transcriptional regulator [Halocatena marina]